MKRPMILRFLLTGLASASLLSAAAPAAADDPRLRTLIYDDAAVVTINGRVKVQTTIKFGEDEAIENVAIGDSTAWQVQPNKAQSILFVKPLATAARTNMTVVTSKRTYLFDLVASPRNRPLYVLQFRYPKVERAKEEARLAAIEAAKQEQANAAELAAANDPYAVADPARLNFAWEGDGDRDLLPARAYDNGEALFLTWSKDASVPVILVTNDDGVEGPVNYTVRGETIVVDQVPGQVILRSGRDSATLTNTGVGAVQVSSRSERGTRKGRRGL